MIKGKGIMFVWHSAYEINVSSINVMNWFFLCLLAVSHTLCKYLTVVLTLLATVDKLMPRREGKRISLMVTFQARALLDCRKATRKDRT
jgi:hypothetical protein